MIFAPTKPERIAAKQLLDAQRGHLEHQSAAEYHQAMSEMFRKQVERLSDQIKEKKQ